LAKSSASSMMPNGEWLDRRHAGIMADTLGSIDG
jgi:hypothetical protein